MGDREGLLRAKLLAWYHAEKRDLPWRRTRDPYAILVSECLLQRTRIRAAIPYYDRFLATFPTVEALAAAPEADVLRAWEGLGFYSRGRKLHAAAREIVARWGGTIPADFEALRSLPGVGPYTAGAVGSIAFGLRVPALDGNARRALSRVFWSLREVRTAAGLQSLAADLVPPDEPGAWNQALMELGAMICIPRRPRCEACPIRAECDAFAAGVQNRVPPRTPSTNVPTVAVMFALVERSGRILLVQRPPRGLLAALWAFPGGEASSAAELAKLVREQTGLDLSVEGTIAKVRHTFSHRRWAGRIVRAGVRSGRNERGRWFAQQELGSVAMVPFHRRALAQVHRRQRGQETLSSAEAVPPR